MIKDTSILVQPSLAPSSGGCQRPAAQVYGAGERQVTQVSASDWGRDCGSRGSAWLSSGVRPARSLAAPAQNPNRAPTSPPTAHEDRTVSGSELGSHTAGDDDPDQGLNCRDQGRTNRTQPNPVRSTPPAQEPPPQRGLQAPWRRACAARLPAWQNTMAPAPHSSPLT